MAAIATLGNVMRHAGDDKAAKARHDAEMAILAYLVNWHRNSAIRGSRYQSKNGDHHAVTEWAMMKRFYLLAFCLFINGCSDHYNVYPFVYETSEGYVMILKHRVVRENLPMEHRLRQTRHLEYHPFVVSYDKSSLKFVRYCNTIEYSGSYAPMDQILIDNMSSLENLRRSCGLSDLREADRNVIRSAGFRRQDEEDGNVHLEVSIKSQGEDDFVDKGAVFTLPD